MLMGHILQGFHLLHATGMSLRLPDIASTFRRYWDIWGLEGGNGADGAEDGVSACAEVGGELAEEGGEIGGVKLPFKTGEAEPSLHYKAHQQPMNEGLKGSGSVFINRFYREYSEADLIKFDGISATVFSEM